MRRTKILNATVVKRTSYTEATNAFYRHLCFALELLLFGGEKAI